MAIEIKYLKNKKSVDELKELIHNYLESNKENEPHAELMVQYFQDEEGNYTNKGDKYVKVQKEIYNGEEWKVKIE